MRGGNRYHNAIVPPVIQRNVSAKEFDFCWLDAAGSDEMNLFDARQLFENPAWYTAYTPYSPEQSQGRLESLLNYQTVITSLSGLPIANASLLDESTAAAEAMTMCLATSSKSAAPNVKGKVFVVSENVSPQTLAVLRTRSKGFGITVKIVPDSELESALEEAGKSCFGLMVQYPDVHGGIKDHHALASKAKSLGVKVVAATDLLALTMLKPPGEWGADIVLGNSARFGVPVGYGGPHAAFFACTEALKRKMPGRLVGVSRDTRGEKAHRLALQSESSVGVSSDRAVGTDTG